jgi:FeS assembly SUF system regulator
MIRITKLTDYGILVLTQLVRSGGLCTARDLATASAVPEPTVGKILRLLTRSGLTESQRGAQGGYTLVRDPTKISVADIIEAFEGPIALTACLSPEAPACEVEPICQTRTNWDRINRAIRTALEDIPLSEIARPLSIWSEQLDVAAAPPQPPAVGDPS